MRDERGVEAMKGELPARSITRSASLMLSGGGAQKNMGKLDGSSVNHLREIKCLDVAALIG